MKLVIALGGNALNRRGEKADAPTLRKNVVATMSALAAVAMDHQLVVTHGNGPQIGLLALQNLSYEDVDAYPLDILGAETQGMVGYVIGQELENALKRQKEIATVLTTTVVSPSDPAYEHPTKFVGPVYSEFEANRLAAKFGWDIAEDGQWWRRVVPSPKPQAIEQSGTIAKLLDLGLVVISVGGGGVPVFLDAEQNVVTGTEAVVDKDLASAVLAKDIEADRLLILTDVPGAYVDWGTPHQRLIKTISPAAAKALDFAAGSMGPKVEAAANFALTSGGEGVIGSLDALEEIMTGNSGTRVFQGAELTFY